MIYKKVLTVSVVLGCREYGRNPAKGCQDFLCTIPISMTVIAALMISFTAWYLIYKKKDNMDWQLAFWCISEFTNLSKLPWVEEELFCCNDPAQSTATTLHWIELFSKVPNSVKIIALNAQSTDLHRSACACIRLDSYTHNY